MSLSVSAPASAPTTPATAGSKARLPRGLSLRARTALALSVGALVLSSAIGMAAYQVARGIEIGQQRETLRKQALLDAAGIQRALQRTSGTAPRTQAQAARSELAEQTDAKTFLVFVDTGRIVGDDEASTGFEIVPKRVLEVAQQDGAAEQLISTVDGPRLVVAVRIDREVQATFVEIASLDRVESYLRRLSASLATAALLSAAGAAALGWLLSARVLRPLRSVAKAARGIAGGRLDTRLDETGDRDLDPLVTSFNDMASSLQIRLEREARFASDVSHELRTPLTSLGTAARLLDGRRDEMSERSQKALDILLTQSTHFERLVLDLLEISRFDAGAVELHCDEVDVGELIRQVASLNDSSHVQINIGDSVTEPTYLLDKRRIERILANLLQNATLYAGGATSVSVSAIEPGPPARLRICVDDGGPGVAENERVRIFERFNRGQSHAQRTGPKGTGLGLSLVAEHARLHGGKVWVEPNDVGGARFVVEITEGI